VLRADQPDALAVEALHPVVLQPGDLGGREYEAGAPGLNTNSQSTTARRSRSRRPIRRSRPILFRNSGSMTVIQIPAAITTIAAGPM